MPVRAAAVASAAVTVVLPTPPLPATITTREVAQKRSRSMATDATGVPIARRMRRGACVACSRSSSRVRCSRSTPSPAQRRRPVGRRGIDVVQVEGYLDPPNVSLILDAIDEANDEPLDTADPPGRSRPARSTPTSRRSSARSSARRSRSRCGSGRRVPTPRARPRSCCRPRTSRSSPRAPASGPASRCGSTIPTRAPRAGVADRLGDARPERNGRDPEGARKLASVRLGSAAARRRRCDRRRAAHGRRGHRAARRQDRHHRGRRRRALDRQGDRRRAGPAPPAQPGRRVQPARPRRLSCCTG